MIRISVITICLNDLNGLKKTVRSVLMQDYENIEYIIVDGGSVDGTADYVCSMAEEHKHIIFLHGKDDGRSDAFNKGTKIATGELVIYLNSSDFFLDTNVVSDAVMEWRDSQVDVLGYNVAIDTGRIMYADDSMWSIGFIPHQGMFIRKNALERVGLYNKYLINRMDYDLCLKLKEEGCTHRFINKVIVQYDSSGISSTDHYNARLEGLGLELIYRKSVKKEDIDTILELYNEGSDGDRVISVEDVCLSNTKYVALQKRYMIIRSILNMMCNGDNLALFLANRGIKRVSVYGMGDVGCLLYKLLSNSKIDVPYCIDRDKRKKVYGVEIRQIESVTEDIQAIIISNVVGIDTIAEDIKRNTNCQVFSVYDLLKG